tara:strand:- start:1582 stop:1860 length:279 start_codon:yes stop_codon:yes gene_type:complete
LTEGALLGAVVGVLEDTSVGAQLVCAATLCLAQATLEAVFWLGGLTIAERLGISLTKTFFLTEARRSTQGGDWNATFANTLFDAPFVSAAGF